MKADYQVGDLFCATWDEKQMFLLQEYRKMSILCVLWEHISLMNTEKKVLILALER